MPWRREIQRLGEVSIGLRTIFPDDTKASQRSGSDVRACSSQFEYLRYETVFRGFTNTTTHRTPEALRRRRPSTIKARTLRSGREIENHLYMLAGRAQSTGPLRDRNASYDVLHAKHRARDAAEARLAGGG